MNYQHLMIDIETLGSKSNSAICSIGAVPFNLDGQTGSPFFEKIQLSSALKAGLKVDADTIEWWSQQNPELFKAMLGGKNSLSSVLYTFIKYISFELDENVQVWGNGSRFDLGLLSDAFEAVGLSKPWDFRNERDVRTIVMLNPEIKNSIPKPHNLHYPIADCRYQIEYLTHTLKSIGYGIHKQEADSYFQYPA